MICELHDYEINFQITKTNIWEGWRKTEKKMFPKCPMMDFEIILQK